MNREAGANCPDRAALEVGDQRAKLSAPDAAARVRGAKPGCTAVTLVAHAGCEGCAVEIIAARSPISSPNRGSEYRQQNGDADPADAPQRLHFQIEDASALGDVGARVHLFDPVERDGN